jgi:hypothetical protein
MTEIPPELLRQSLKESGAGIPDMEDIDYAGEFLTEIDYPAQLRAIRDLLDRHAEEERLVTERIQRISATEPMRQQFVDEAVAEMHASVYQDAAHSMAAVGMLAPLIETIFRTAFLNIGVRYDSQPRWTSTHVRLQRPGKTRWDCGSVLQNEKWVNGLVEGVRELSDALELTSALPPGFWPRFEALIAYRNKMFHHGFEWADKVRDQFWTKVEASGFFSAATTDGRPWIVYMTAAFTRDLLGDIERILSVIGALAKAHPPPADAPCAPHRPLS